MANEIKPGQMGATGEEGVMPPPFADSMAARIESELNSILFGEGRDQFDPDDNTADARDRRMLFVAIARGVVQYIADNPGAFHLKLSRDGGGRVTDVQIVVKVADRLDVVINSE